MLYAISRAPHEAAKTTRACEILNCQDLVLSVQVLQEFYVQATRRSHPNPISHQQATQLIESFKRYPVIDLTLAIVEAALVTRERFEVSYWDAAIIEAARVASCSVLLTEDLNDGQDFGGLRVENPFRVG